MALAVGVDSLLDHGCSWDEKGGNGCLLFIREIIVLLRERPPGPCYEEEWTTHSIPEVRRRKRKAKDERDLRQPLSMTKRIRNLGPWQDRADQIRRHRQQHSFTTFCHFPATIACGFHSPLSNDHNAKVSQYMANSCKFVTVHGYMSKYNLRIYREPLERISTKSASAQRHRTTTITHPRNARSFVALLGSDGVLSGTWSISSVGK